MGWCGRNGGRLLRLPVARALRQHLVHGGRQVGGVAGERGVPSGLLGGVDGRVERASIMTPTAQNIANLEADMRQLAEKMVAGGYDADLITLEVEKLVRAYDPCLSCSVH